jgi:hypothetical protein
VAGGTETSYFAGAFAFWPYDTKEREQIPRMKNRIALVIMRENPAII